METRIEEELKNVEYMFYLYPQRGSGSKIDYDEFIDYFIKSKYSDNDLEQLLFLYFDIKRYYHKGRFPNKDRKFCKELEILSKDKYSMDLKKIYQKHFHTFMIDYNYTPLQRYGFILSDFLNEKKKYTVDDLNNCIEKVYSMKYTHKVILEGFYKEIYSELIHHHSIFGSNGMYDYNSELDNIDGLLIYDKVEKYSYMFLRYFDVDLNELNVNNEDYFKSLYEKVKLKYTKVNDNYFKPTYRFLFYCFVMKYFLDDKFEFNKILQS